MSHPHIPLFDLKRQLESLEPALLEAAARVLGSGRYVLGTEVTAFESELARHLGVPEVIGTSSGTDALVCALRALQLAPGDEVITSDFTFAASAEAILRAGAQPVLVDIDPETFNLDPARVNSAITPRTRVILPVHLFGRVCDMTRLCELAKHHRLDLVEDAAQAFGSRFEGQLAGTFGDSGCFSFFPSKTLGAAGDAGAVATRRADLAGGVRRLRRHGLDERYGAQELGGNYRLDELQAALLRVKLSHAAAWCSARRAVGDFYFEAFRERGLELDPAAFFAKSSPVAAAAPATGEAPVWSQFVIRAERRDALAEALASRGIRTAVYYPHALSRQPLFARHARGENSESRRAAREALALPMFPELTESEVRRVVDAIARFYRGG